MSYHLNLKRIKLKESCEGPHWLPNFIKSRQKNEIYWTATVWEQVPFSEEIDKSDCDIDAAVAELKEKFKDNIRITGNVKGDVLQHNPLYANGIDDTIKFGPEGFELWRGDLSTKTLNYNIWVMESDEDLRNFGQLLQDITDNIDEDTIVTFFKAFIESAVVSPTVALTMAIGTIIGKILQKNNDDLVGLSEGSLYSTSQGNYLDPKPFVDTEIEYGKFEMGPRIIDYDSKIMKGEPRNIKIIKGAMQRQDKQMQGIFDDTLVNINKQKWKQIF